jgi:hypothetical protein
MPNQNESQVRRGITTALKALEEVTGQTAPPATIDMALKTTTPAPEQLPLAPDELELRREQIGLARLQHRFTALEDGSVSHEVAIAFYEHFATAKAVPGQNDYDLAEELVRTQLTDEQWRRENAVKLGIRVARKSLSVARKQCQNGSARMATAT